MTPTSRAAATPRPGAGALAIATGVLGLTLGAVGPAMAIPPGGASPDTPGTSSTVGPRRLPAGGTLSYSVSGFPAGEVVSIKIDDGAYCSSTAHGACVVQQQRIGSNGRASGSLVVPSDLPAGAHWLRYLASKELPNGAGVKPYTRRGGSDFRVVAAGTTGSSGGTGSTGSSSGSSTGSAGSTASTSTTSGSSVTTAPGAAPVTQVSGEVLKRVTAAGKSLVVARPKGTTDSATAATTTSDDDSASAASSTTATPSAASAQSSDNGFPVVGAAGAALAVVAALALALGLRPRRRRG